MISKERILCAISGIPGYYLPFTTWCFGFQPPEHLRWKTNGKDINYCYTKRLEHIHTLPQPWTLEDDLNDFWSPDLFDMFVFPNLCKLTSLAHSYGKKFAYVMTTGIETLGPSLADAGVDVLYFVDPVMYKISLQKASELFGNRMTMVGGISAVDLNNIRLEQINQRVKEAIDILGPTNRFILHPLDSIFPDTS